MPEDVRRRAGVSEKDRCQDRAMTWLPRLHRSFPIDPSAFGFPEGDQAEAGAVTQGSAIDRGKEGQDIPVLGRGKYPMPEAWS